MDETRLQVLKEPGRRAESQSYLWVQRGGPPDHPILLYDYAPSRSQRVPIRLLDGFSGYLLFDGYEAYGKVCAEYGLTAVGCWAHGRLQIDNNLTENAIRPFVIGRKDFLFCDSVAGANTSANLYSLIETAKANGIEPYAHLRSVFTELPQATSVDEIDALLPVSDDGADCARVS